MKSHKASEGKQSHQMGTNGSRLEEHKDMKSYLYYTNDKLQGRTCSASSSVS